GSTGPGIPTPTPSSSPRPWRASSRAVAASSAISAGTGRPGSISMLRRPITCPVRTATTPCSRERVRCSPPARRDSGTIRYSVVGLPGPEEKEPLSAISPRSISRVRLFEIAWGVTCRASARAARETGSPRRATARTAASWAPATRSSGPVGLTALILARGRSPRGPDGPAGTGPQPCDADPVPTSLDVTQQRWLIVAPRSTTPSRYRPRPPRPRHDPHRRSRPDRAARRHAHPRPARDPRTPPQLRPARPRPRRGGHRRLRVRDHGPPARDRRRTPRRPDGLRPGRGHRPRRPPDHRLRAGGGRRRPGARAAVGALEPHLDDHRPGRRPRRHDRGLRAHA